MGWTESYYISYQSTQIITLTSTIPCLITTSYTTTYVYDCNECHGSTTSPIPPPGIEQYICSTKSCSAGPNEVEPTNFAPGESAQANLVDANSNIIGQTDLGADHCTIWYPFDNQADADNLPACGGDVPDSGGGTCGVSVITYNYVTDGQTIQTATTIPQHGCGPYEKLSGFARRHDSSGIQVLFYVWAVAAVTSALGMLLL